MSFVFAVSHTRKVNNFLGIAEILASPRAESLDWQLALGLGPVVTPGIPLAGPLLADANGVNVTARTGCGFVVCILAVGSSIVSRCQSESDSGWELKLESVPGSKSNLLGALIDDVC